MVVMCLCHDKRCSASEHISDWTITFRKSDFRVAFRLCFKASPRAKPFIWKLVLFKCKWTKICVRIKPISTWKASHLDWLWNRRRNATRKSLLLQAECYPCESYFVPLTITHNSFTDPFAKCYRTFKFIVKHCVMLTLIRRISQPEACKRSGLK